MLRKIVASDYRSLSFEAFSEMVAPEGAGRLDETKVYGVQRYNRGKALLTRTAPPSQTIVTVLEMVSLGVRTRDLSGGRVEAAPSKNLLKNSFRGV